MKDIDVTDSIKYRESWTDGEVRPRTETIVYLSELPDGTLAGTEKMTRTEYAVRQKKMRLALGNLSKGLFFAESAPAVAYRAKKGMIREERQYGIWVVWEEAGPRHVSKRTPSKKPKKAGKSKEAVKKDS